jgi:hypothetical protein
MERSVGEQEVTANAPAKAAAEDPDGRTATRPVRR